MPNVRPPGPDLLGLLRALPCIRRFAPGYLVELAAAYPRAGVIALPVPDQAVFLAASPRAARDVLVGDASAWSKDTVQYRSLARLTGAGLLTADGDGWRTVRRLLAPAFAADGLTPIARRTTEAMAQFLDTHVDRGPVDVEPGLLLAAFGVLVDGVFGTTLRANADHLVRAVLDGLDVVVADVELPVPALLRGRRDARMQAANAALDEAADQLVAAWRRDPVGDPQRHPLAILVAGMDDGTLTRRQVRDELVTMVIAGHETVASAMAWTLWWLARNPQVQRRLRGESGLPSVSGRDGQADAYLRAVVDESLRLHPPAWVVSRTSVRPTVVAGQQVPAGALAIVSPWQLHRRQADWGEHAETFDPMRFLGERSERQASREGCYLPFGAGPRLCIGRELALVQMRTAVGEVTRSVELTVARDPEPHALVTVRPKGGMWLSLASRQ